MDLTLDKETVIEGDKVTMKCKVTDPTMCAVWKRDEEELCNTDSVKMEVSGLEHVLEIFQIRVADSGEYSICVNNVIKTKSLCVKGNAICMALTIE